VDGNLEQQTPLPPPVAATPSASPIMPKASSNSRPHIAGVTPTAYVPPPAGRSRRRRTRVYTVGVAVFLAICVAGYLGFRSYIYGDDAPPVPVLDDLSD